MHFVVQVLSSRAVTQLNSGHGISSSLGIARRKRHRTKCLHLQASPSNNQSPLLLWYNMFQRQLRCVAQATLSPGKANSDKPVISLNERLLCEFLSTNPERTVGMNRRARKEHKYKGTGLHCRRFRLSQRVAVPVHREAPEILW